MTFRDLNLTAALLNALDDLGVKEPTTIQEKTFPVILSGRDVCGIAQTGTGKTIAYLLPSLRLANFDKSRFPQILILVPTRELVLQVLSIAKDLSKYRSLEIVGIYGGVNMKPQAAAVENGCDMIVATPGRLLDMILNGYLKTKNIKKLVIDEMDEMLNLGFRTQINRVLDLLPEKRQNLLFSATITPEVEALLDQYFNSPIRIEAAPAGTPLAQIEQVGYELPNFYTKANLLELLLNQHEEMNKVLVFAATKHIADQLFQEMESRFPEQVGVLHSNKDQNYRLNTVQRFKEGQYRFIIATDLVARGIDIASVSHVINFDVPEIRENYIHRIGRTGRADQSGKAITFVTEKERKQLGEIEALMDYSIPFHPLPQDLEISSRLTDEEQPKVFIREVQLKLPKREDVGPAFHPKSAKNTKVNIKTSHKDKMMQKYGKKKTRGAKKK